MRLLITTVVLIFGFSFAQAQEWYTNIDEAKEVAKAKNRKIVMVFQGSDWCAPCMKLDKEIWSTESFQAYAKDNLIMLKLDFPRKRANKLSKEQKKHNGQLFNRYNKPGTFPYVAVINAEGKLLGTSGYKNISVEEYIKELDGF
jgi:thioredoxin-related protein